MNISNFAACGRGRAPEVEFKRSSLLCMIRRLHQGVLPKYCPNKLDGHFWQAPAALLMKVVEAADRVGGQLLRDSSHVGGCAQNRDASWFPFPRWDPFNMNPRWKPRSLLVFENAVHGMGRRSWCCWRSHARKGHQSHRGLHAVLEPTINR